jgi:ABC-type siderophore export system fused ATPase/permease subunit
VPTIILIVVAIAVGQIIVHNPSLADQLGATIKKGFDKKVQEGQMPQERADQVYEQFARPGSMMFTIFQIGAIVVGTPFFLFLLGLVYWLLGKWGLKASAPYMKVVEVIGLTFYIGALGSIITILMMVAMDSIYASPSLAVFVSNFSMENKLHLALAKVNVFTIWTLVVVSIGLAKIFQRDYPKVLTLILALWVLWFALAIILGINLGM